MTQTFGSTECSILGHDMLDEILFILFTEYLTIEDISRIDVAMCNTAKRKAFLNLIRSERCIFNSERGQKSGYILWLGLRSIQTKQLNCDLTISYEELSKIAPSSKWLQKLDLFGCQNISDTILIKIVESCPNLLRLYLPLCFNITDKSVIRIAESCPNLVQLDLVGCNISDNSVVKITESCLQLRLLHVAYNGKISSECYTRIAQNCPHLRIIRMRFLGL
jgi:hypothetical protein